MRYLLLITFFISSSFALVSIAPVDIGAKPGVSGSVAGAFSHKKGNTDKEEYTLGVKLQYDQGSDYLVWSNLIYEYGESLGVKNEDRVYAHLRFIYAVDGPKWRAELFAQTEQDAFKDINERSLLGTGLRWRFLDAQEWGKCYLGMGLFHERVDYANPMINPEETQERYNSYVGYTKSFMTESRLNYIGYYQPKIGENSDFVMTQTVELLIPIYGRLNLSLCMDYSYDSRPPTGVEKKDREYKTSLLWEF